MAKGKLIALASAGMLAVLLVSTGAQAGTDLAIRAGGVLIDGSGTASGSANVIVTLPDDGDPMTALIPVGGIPIEYWIGDFKVPCDPEIATTDPNGVARCGLLGHADHLLANGGHYEARFVGNEAYNPNSDEGSLIYNANVGDIP
jgi:hypothetical protein